MLDLKQERQHVIQALMEWIVFQLAWNYFQRLMQSNGEIY